MRPTRWLPCLVLICILVLEVVAPTAEARVRGKEFLTPSANSGPYGITTGPDGNLWFTEANANDIVRVEAGGVITVFPIPTPGGGPSVITTGADGALWFIEE